MKESHRYLCHTNAFLTTNRFTFFIYITKLVYSTLWIIHKRVFFVIKHTKRHNFRIVTYLYIYSWLIDYGNHEGEEK